MDLYLNPGLDLNLIVALHIRAKGGRASGRTCCMKFPRCMSVPKNEKLATYSSTMRIHGDMGIAGATGGRRASGADLFWRTKIDQAAPEVQTLRRPHQKVKPVTTCRHISVRQATCNAA